MTVAPHIVGDRKTLERYVGYSRLIHTHAHTHTHTYKVTYIRLI